MAFGGFSQENHAAPVSEINMVPLIDVMLVLLIVFMITAPLLTHAVKIDLPAAASASTDARPETITLALDDTGALYWNDRITRMTELPTLLAEIAARPQQPELHLRADRDTRYQALAEIMAAARLAGVHKIGFITHPSD
jgi:biopolymer transport protein ExbD